MKTKATLLLIVLAALGVYAGYHHWQPARGRPALVTTQPSAPATESLASARSATTIETPHYTIASSASPLRTALVADAAESLYDAYMALFGSSKIDTDRPRLKLVLYKDQREFKANNRSSPWAEAFYLAPYCHAYYADGSNPYHWMVHEATHQLNHEIAGLRQATWMEEGLATYFGASRIRDRKLTPGAIATDAYPIWWLPRADAGISERTSTGTTSATGA